MMTFMHCCKSRKLFNFHDVQLIFINKRAEYGLLMNSYLAKLLFIQNVGYKNVMIRFRCENVE